MSWWNFWSRSSGAKDDDAAPAPANSANPPDTAADSADMRTFTATELAKFTGENGTPVYVSVKGKVYDCTSGAGFYGPGKSYAVFAGKEVSRCLGKMLISDEEANAGWDDLTAEQMQTLNEWDAKFESKYPVVGKFQPGDEFYARQKKFAK